MIALATLLAAVVFAIAALHAHFYFWSGKAC